AHSKLLLVIRSTVSNIGYKSHTSDSAVTLENVTEYDHYSA
ncbi:MAG: hypothetical protein ACI9JO_000226, partial [Psychrobacter okhotskensis]